MTGGLREAGGRIRHFRKLIKEEEEERETGEFLEFAVGRHTRRRNSAFNAHACKGVV